MSTTLREESEGLIDCMSTTPRRLSWWYQLDMVGLDLDSGRCSPYWNSAKPGVWFVMQVHICLGGGSEWLPSSLDDSRAQQSSLDALSITHSLSALSLHRQFTPVPWTPRSTRAYDSLLGYGEPIMQPWSPSCTVVSVQPSEPIGRPWGCMDLVPTFLPVFRPACCGSITPMQSNLWAPRCRGYRRRHDCPHRPHLAPGRSLERSNCAEMNQLGPLVSWQR